MPAPSALVDSGAALTELAAFHVARDSMRFTVVFPEGDSIPLIHPLESTDTLAAAVLARSIWPQKPGELWAIQVRASGGSAPALTVQRSTYCPPAVKEGANQPFHEVIGVLRSERLRPGSRADIADQSGTPRPPPSLNAVYEVVVSVAGAARNVKLIRGSGVAEYDLKYGKYVAQLKFDPALIDGMPVEAVYRTDKKSPRQ